jgi:FkbH-like protein
LRANGIGDGDMIADTVKLVIWDLDDTFWRGTLAEGDIEPIPANIERVTELAARGIVSAICSKNDFEQAKARLTALGVYEYFVFPSIGFSPKGHAVTEIVEGTGLRAQNTLFIDDNPLNRAEVKHFNPDIMVGDPAGLLETLLDHPHLAGKPDPDLTRLKQYRSLQRKFEERKITALSNEEFLRASNIRVTIDYDIGKNFERIVELLNRTNQLNYTKQRLHSDADIAAFRALLESFGAYAGCVFAADTYGDYGLIGFFLVQRRAGERKLVHFVFSCRTMHMGIEQYVYELIEKPDLTVVEPVAYGLRSHAAIDWINSEAETADGAENSAAGNGRLVLLGGCDLLQVASYCSTNRLEFVNTIVDGVKVRYDDPGFVLSDRRSIRDCAALRAAPFWTYEDAVRFDAGVAAADIVLVSLWMAMLGKYFRTAGGVVIRMGRVVRMGIKQTNPEWLSGLEQMSYDEAARLDLVAASLDAIADRSGAGCRIIVLSQPVRGFSRESRLSGALAFNKVCADGCARRPGKMRYVDLDLTIPAEAVIDGAHFSRAGYHALAREILARAAV